MSHLQKTPVFYFNIADAKIPVFKNHNRGKSQRITSVHSDCESLTTYNIMPGVR